MSEAVRECLQQDREVEFINTLHHKSSLFCLRIRGLLGLLESKYENI